MQQTRPAQYGLRWSDNSFGELDPVWTISPDITVIKRLAIQYLPDEFKNPDVSFFAEGAFNKLYDISSPFNRQRYLMRVSLPVEPFFKTESEVATIAYLRKHTSIPVPQIIAYDSSAENDLKFEWILMERIQGSSLYDVWEKMSYDSKVDLTIHVADLLRQLDGLHFTQIGNLYFSTVKDRVDDKRHIVKENITDGENVDMDIGNEFVIGRIVSPWFFRDKRVWLRGDRGPFPSSYECMLAETDIQIERIMNLSPLPTDEYYSETDEELAEDQKAILETCNRLNELVSVIFPVVDSEKKMLYHSDLSGGNILVDPVTYCITGIVDWECVSIRPAWDVCGYPHFLKGIEVMEPPPVGTPGINEDSLYEIRKYWEKVLLRRVYKGRVPNTVADNQMEPTVEAMSNYEEDVMLKRKFAHKLAEIEMRWTAARYWMNNLDLPKQHPTSN